MSMLAKVIEARKAQEAEKARRDRIVWDSMMTRWRLYLATWNRVEAAMRELVGTRVRLFVRRDAAGKDAYEVLPLELERVNPPDPEKPKTVGYGDGILRLRAFSDRIRQPLSPAWVPPPPPKRKPKGWTPPQPPPGNPYVINFISVSCRFETGYWSGDNAGSYSLPLDDYALGKKVWKTDDDYSPHNKENGTEGQVLAYIANRVAERLVAEEIPELQQLAAERAVEAAGRPLDVGVRPQGQLVLPPWGRRGPAVHAPAKDGADREHEGQAAGGLWGRPPARQVRRPPAGGEREEVRPPGDQGRGDEYPRRAEAAAEGEVT